MDIHFEKAMEAKDADSNAERTKIERDMGVRYSELLRLPYLNIVRCHLIDSMHNLFLGIAKNVISLWKGKNIITDATFSLIEQVVHSISVPAHVGRLPEKIGSGCLDLLQNNGWLGQLFFSPYVLRDILPPQHYEMWCTFSLSCSLLCRPFIHHSEILKADELLI